MSHKFGTLVETLYFEAKIDGPSRGLTFIDDDGAEQSLSYRELLDQAYVAADALQRAGVQSRERVLMIIPTSGNFAALFFGLLLIGAIPCPVSLPAGFGDEAFGGRVAWLGGYLEAKHVLTIPFVRELLVEANVPLTSLIDAELMAPLGREPSFTAAKLEAHDVAMIQCTSASTGNPKGVLLTHDNLISNIHQIGFCLGNAEETVPVCWLPLYHDMGLIGCFLFSIYWNVNAVFLSPLRFLRQPVSWLQAISKHKGTVSPAPNFAYSYVTTRAREAELDGLDLSSFRIALCGAEPIDPRTLLRFQERFAAYGLRKNVVSPCYGLAEATLAVTIHAIGTPLGFDRVSRDAIATRGEVIDLPGDEGSVLITNCGPPMNEMKVKIVGEDGAPLPENRVGQVLVSGPTIMKGYHDRPDETGRALQGGWLATGDLGYLRGGELRITGRSKDLVIIRGRNYAPSDFEWAVSELAGVRKGNVVAFGITDATQGTEALHLMCESDLTDDAACEALKQTIREHVGARTGVVPAGIELVPRNTVPKTSSGKLQRSKAKELYMAAQAWKIQ